MCTYVKSSTHSKVLHNSHSTLVFTMKEFQYLLCLPRKISVLSQLHIIHAPASISHTRRINFFQSTFQRKLICMRNGTSGSKNSSEWVEFPPPPKSFWKIMKYIFFSFCVQFTAWPNKMCQSTGYRLASGVNGWYTVCVEFQTKIVSRVYRAVLFTRQTLITNVSYNSAPLPLPVVIDKVVFRRMW